MGGQPLALVIGATGGFGGETAERLAAHGWRVRAMHRRPDPARAAATFPAEWVAGDAMNPADVRRAAEGARAIVHGAHPPGYRNWKGLALPMLESTLGAAKAEGARILFPGTVYNYGPDAFPQLSEDSPQHPRTRKGAIRAAMEARLAQAAQEGVKSVTIRAGDFFGVRGAQSWMGGVMFRKGRPLTSLMYPGPLGMKHAWAYLPDLAEAAVRLLDREAELSAHASFHFAGHAVTGRELVAAFEAVLGRKVRVWPFPWPAVHAAGPFNETLRELPEMRYLWRDEVLLDNRRLLAELGEEPHTPLAEALRATLSGLGSLP
jgi:nucleoside-diphosphate-sugar epimerase